MAHAHLLHQLPRELKQLSSSPLVRVDNWADDALQTHLEPDGRLHADGRPDAECGLTAIGERVESSVADPEPCVEVDRAGGRAFDELLVLVRALLEVLDDGDRRDGARDGDESLERRLNERLTKRCSQYISDISCKRVGKLTLRSGSLI